MAAGELVLAMTGASGAPYAVRLLEVLLRAGRVVHLTISPAATEVVEQELGRRIRLDAFVLDDLIGQNTSTFSGKLQYHHYRDYHSSIASGSHLTAGMVVCPCSMGTLAAIAQGISQNLIHRAADVHLKERRRLILVPRETPLSPIHLRNMTLLAETGATILAAMPAFYTKPKSLADVVDFIVGRICDQFGVQHGLFQRWGEELPSDSTARE
jgi:4-hydroxy-3-polyprenylbenzoate decarboxylase